MYLSFTKMHGLGNDFVVLDGTDTLLALHAQHLRTLADRHRGVGCDQILLIEPASHPQADFDYRIFNADGSEVEHCGNGARCVALFLRASGLSAKSSLVVHSRAGLIRLRYHDLDHIEVQMGIPNFEPAHIPMAASDRLPYYQLDDGIAEHAGSASDPLRFGAVSLGNPHAVLDVADLATAEVEKIGRALQSHPFFPQRVNVGFRQIVDRHYIRLRVFERGVGETHACGTGACAAVVTGIAQGLLAEQVTVSLSGGDLSIRWPGDGHDISMTGPARSVYQGGISL